MASKSTIAALARGTASIASPLLGMKPWRRLVTGIEDYSAFLAGRGAGSGWDLASEAAVAASVLRRDDAVVFDVGANDGRWSALVSAAMAGRRLRLHLFECAPPCIEALKRHLPELPGAELHEVAVSDHCGCGTLSCPVQGSGLASLHQRGDTGVTRQEYRDVEVELRTVDSLAAELGVDRIDFLKLDIEGHELFALRGASGLLAEGRIDHVAFEFGSANVNSRTFFRDFWELFTDAGFTLSRIAPGGRTVPIPRYDDHLEYFRGATNYLAARTRQR